MGRALRLLALTGGLLVAACEPRLEAPLSGDDLTPTCGSITREVLVLFESSKDMETKPNVVDCPKGLQGQLCERTTPTKFQIAGEALQAAVDQYAGQVGVGVLIYPSAAIPDFPRKPFKSAACSVSFVGKVFGEWCERATLPGKPTPQLRCQVDAAPQKPIGEAYNGIEYGVRAEGRAPLAEALAVAYAYYLDRPSTGRMRNVVVITDGVDTCDGDPLAAIQQLRHLNVNVWIAGFSGYEPELAGLASRSRNTREQSSWGYYNIQDGGLNLIFENIANATLEEVCDGVDNDCDGRIDEDLVRDCDAACGGVQVCQLGAWRACLPERDVMAQPGSGLYVPSELCDGIDNDCNGDTDEGLGLGEPCERRTGVCVNTGALVCDELGQVACSATVPEVGPEVCDGVDNDCDGEVDEGTAQACSDGCLSGWRQCVQGGLGECVLDSALPEICDGEDNDCDGEIDEGFGVGDPCTKEGSTGCMAEGVKVCSEDGLSTECEADVPAPQPETCNQKDDDCDGEIDEGDLCGLPWICWQGQCVLD